MSKYGIIDWIKGTPDIREEIVEFLRKMNEDPDYWRQRKEKQAAYMGEISIENIIAYHKSNGLPLEFTVCTKCQKQFPRSPEFWHARKGGRNGLTRRCKNCLNKNSQRKREERRALAA
jgi:hypothetical protein